MQHSAYLEMRDDGVNTATWSLDDLGVSGQTLESVSEDITITSAIDTPAELLAAVESIMQLAK